MIRAKIAFCHNSDLPPFCAEAPAFVSFDQATEALPEALRLLCDDPAFWGPVAALFACGDRLESGQWLGLMSRSAGLDFSGGSGARPQRAYSHSLEEARSFGWSGEGVLEVLGAAEAKGARVILGAPGLAHLPGMPERPISMSALLEREIAEGMSDLLIAQVEAHWPDIALHLKAVLGDTKRAALLPVVMDHDAVLAVVDKLEGLFQKLMPHLGWDRARHLETPPAVLIAGTVLEAFSRSLPDGSVMDLPIVHRGYARAPVHPLHVLDKVAQQRADARRGAVAGGKQGEAIHIVLAIDEAYAPHAAATIASVLDHAGSPARLCFHVLEDGTLSGTTRGRLRAVAETGGAELSFVATDQSLLADLPLNRDHVSKATYYRLAMAQALPADVTRAIYLDADVIVTDDLALLWAEDMAGKPLAAAPDEGGRTQAERLHLPKAHRYFNAGVVVFDLERLRLEPLVAAVKDCMARHGDVIILQDQDLLNLIFAGRTHELPLRWNANNRLYGDADIAPAYTPAEALAAAVAPGILHFTDRRKPWHGKNLNPLAVLYWKYRHRTGFRERLSQRFVRHAKHGLRRLFSKSQRAAEAQLQGLPRAFRLEAGRRYWVASNTPQAQRVTFCHPCGTRDVVLLPFDGFRRFVFAPMKHDVWLYPDPDSGPHLLKVQEGGPRAARGQGADWDAAKAMARPRYAAPLHYGGCIHAVSKCSKGAARERLAQLRGMDLGSESLATLASSQMLQSEFPGALPVVQVPERCRIGVALHLHYRDLWEEFEACLAPLGQDILLHVSITETDDHLSMRIRARFPNALIDVVENLGRDIRPFVEAYRGGVFDDCAVICKLHGKRSALSGKDRWFGHQWRRRNLVDLLGSKERIAHVLETFRRRPEVGMMGSAVLRLRRGVGGADPGFETSRATREALCDMAGIARESVREDFFAGTMFWVRTEALAGLKLLTIDRENYTLEGGPVEDGFEHALERLFADCVRGAGYLLEDLEPGGGSHAPLASSQGRIIAPRSQFRQGSSAFQHKWHWPSDGDVAGKNVVLIATRCADWDVPDHVTSIVSAWRKQGFLCVLCCGANDPMVGPPENLRSVADGVLACDFAGFEPAAWAAALRSEPQLWSARRLCLVGERLGMDGDLAAIDIGFSQSDVWALSAGSERPHGLGPLVALNERALAHEPLRAVLTTPIGWNAEAEAAYRFDLRLTEVVRLADDLTFGTGPVPGLQALQKGPAVDALAERDQQLSVRFGILPKAL